MSRRFKLLTFILIVLLAAFIPGHVLSQELGSISGNVTDDSTGLPLAGATVAAKKTDHLFGNQAFTDELGNYTIPELPAGDYIVVAFKEGYHFEIYNNTQKEDSATLVQVVAGQNTPDINFSLTPKSEPQPGSISGNVTDDSTGLPLANAVVVAHKLGTYFAKNASTDESGNYTIHELPAGNYIVGACREGYRCELYDNTQKEESATVVVVVADQNTPNINFALTAKEAPPEFGSISGTVTDFDTGEPIEGAILVAFDVIHHLEEYHSKARTDSNGNYTIDNLFPSEYRVIVWAEGYNFEVYPETVAVGPGEDVVGINFQLKKKQKGAIAGNVTEKGSGTPLKALVLAHQIEGRGFGRTCTDSTGHYIIEDLPEGQYKVITFAREHHPAVYPEPVPVIGGQTTDGINFELELLPLELTGIIKGTVTDDSTAAPLPKAVIVAFAKHEDHHIVRFTFSQEDGSYALMHLPTIPFYVAAWAKGYMAELYNDAHKIEDATQVTPDAFGIDFALTPKTEHPLVVSGNTILSGNNSPLAGVIVSAFERDGALASASFSLPDGCFYLDGLSFESYNLGVSSTQGNASNYSVDLMNGDNYSANLSLAGSFRGDLTGDSNVNLGDIIAMVNAIFKSMNPPPVQLGDVNCDNNVNLGDIVYLVNFIFKGSSAPCNP